MGSTVKIAEGDVVGGITVGISDGNTEGVLDKGTAVGNPVGNTEGVVVDGIGV